MKTIRFKSILNPSKYGYEFTNDSMTFWDAAYRHGGVLHCSMGYYETFGDGNTQHSTLGACGVSHMTDYLVSLVRHLLANPLEEIQTHAFGLEQARKETILFLATIRYRDDKRQFYNLGDCKTSSSDSKQYDKRWTVVPSWADGTIESAYRLFLLPTERRMELFHVYALQSLFWDTLYSVCSHGDWDKVTAWQKEIPGDHRSAFRAVESLIRGRASLDYALRACDCAQGNTERSVAAPVAA